MRLKSITLIGFKSFVDRTHIDLPKQITAIVGPNGCGKSNTIDAVRWVMGESSAKYLRGESMADVIFNGSIHRAPVGQAAIELHFDNTAGKLGGAYAEYNELAIRRQVTRDGQSHYYLNGTRCRRKDITDIFLGTGLGPRSYAIIEQGTISRLIEAKPEELRVFLEEAAGISRYKERRKETQQRIEHTRDNLTRIHDVREELGKHIAHLERQAKTAEKYKEYKAEERLLRAQLFAWRSKQLQSILETQKIKIATLQTQISEGEQSYAALSTQLQNHFDAQHQIQKDLEAHQLQYAELCTDAKVCEQNIQHNENQQTQFNHELKQIIQQQKEATHLSTLDSSSLEQLTKDLNQVRQTLKQLHTQLEARQKEHSHAATEKNQWQKAWQEVNAEAALSAQTAQVEQTRLQHIEQRLVQLTEQQKKLTEEKSHFTTEEDELHCTELQQKLATLDIRRTEHHKALTEQEVLLATEHERQQVVIKNINDTRHLVQQLDGQLTALNTLQAQALGRTEHNIQAWLSKHALQDSERLANLIEVVPEFESHLEHYLGEKLQAIPLTEFNALSDLFIDLPNAVLHFLHNDKPVHTENNISATSLASKVKGPQALLEQLQHVYCANHLSEALQMIQSLPKNAEVITADGLLVQHHWIQIRRGKDEQSGVLQRKREIADLQKNKLQSIKELEILEAQKQQIEQSIQTTQEQKQQTQQHIQEVEQQKHQLHAALQVKQAQIRQKCERLEKICQELDSATKEYQQLETQYRDTKTLWQNALANLHELNQKKETLSTAQNHLETALQQANNLLRETQEAIHQEKIKEQKYTTEHQGLLLQNQRTNQQLGHLAQRQTTLQEHLAALQPKLAQTKTELLDLNNKLQQAEGLVTQSKNRLNETEQMLRNTENERQTLAAQLEQLKQELSNVQIQMQHAQTKNSSILEQFAELDLVFSEIAESLPETFSEEESQTLLEHMQNKIMRLGAINLAAMNELTELSERKQFIDKQYDDLIEALNTLESAIQEIDKETKTKFQETFDTVNHNFQQLFPKIFGGGQAYLSLTSDNILETGVIVFAQPPGKRNSTIHLLSGGEKALTALALVFGIFELNPAPFCMLDEVDAPLDDVNVGRFCNLVKTMAAKTQFVLVTHNKVAMEMADQLMGVTMQEPGVSRLVAVDVEAAIAMAAVAE